ncbi:hypothetical protein BDY19DRAFT_1051897 [Irpex rosettiformis]|uniref:Uncharacterized protein n=1 Tax=Irpex rosettiformis TaxID=378272 RepID=A0ACB8TMS1_9APHY|nr:hypothetical protein BDY19DRAFT_1051897 [Irpex rosettiformis]
MTKKSSNDSGGDLLAYSKSKEIDEVPMPIKGTRECERLTSGGGGVPMPMEGYDPKNLRIRKRLTKREGGREGGGGVPMPMTKKFSKKNKNLEATRFISERVDRQSNVQDYNKWMYINLAESYTWHIGIVCASDSNEEENEGRGSSGWNVFRQRRV